MPGNLRRRLNALQPAREPRAVVEALAALRDREPVPGGPAGDRARYLWDREPVLLVVTDFDIDEDDPARDPDTEERFTRWLGCHLRATGTTLADVLAHEGPAAAP